MLVRCFCRGESFAQVDNPQKHPQVFFVDDVNDPEWKVVRLKEPRSRRATEADDDGNLSAAGSLHSTRNIVRHVSANIDPNIATVESVSRVDVEDVIASEETGEDDAAFEDVDHVEDGGRLDEEDIVEGADLMNARPVPPHTPVAMDAM